MHKWWDGVWERFRGVRGVSVGRLRVSEDVLQCLLVSLVFGVVLGVIGGVFLLVYLGGNEIRSELLGGFWGFF